MSKISSRSGLFKISKTPLTIAGAKEVLDRASADRPRRFSVVAKRSWSRTLLRLFRLGGTSEGNQVTWLHDGDSAFSQMLQAIASARSRVWLESYILEPDSLGQKFLAALKAAAARNLDVRLLYDSFGSAAIDDEICEGLRADGVQVVAFNPILRFRRHLPVHMRDHRKILLVDEMGFAGGMNISADYAGPKLGNGRFRDTHAHLRGPCIKYLERVFIGSWREACGETLVATQPSSPAESGCFTQVLGSNARRRRRHIQKALRRTVMRSTHTCYLTTPYFVPPRSLVRALNVAARRGVDVRVLVAGDSDVPLARHASNHLAGRLLRNGVRIFELFGQTLHAKTAAIDSIYGAVGSFNLDYWSYRRNLEVHVAAVDTLLAVELEHQFHQDLKSARELTLADWRARGIWRRFRDALAYLLMRA